MRVKGGVRGRNKLTAAVGEERLFCDPPRREWFRKMGDGEWRRVSVLILEKRLGRKLIFGREKVGFVDGNTTNCSPENVVVLPWKHNDPYWRRMVDGTVSIRFGKGKKKVSFTKVSGKWVRTVAHVLKNKLGKVLSPYERVLFLDGDELNCSPHNILVVRKSNAPIIVFCCDCGKELSSGARFKRGRRRATIRCSSCENKSEERVALTVAVHTQEVSYKWFCPGPVCGGKVQKVGGSCSHEARVTSVCRQCYRWLLKQSILWNEIKFKYPYHPKGE